MKTIRLRVEKIITTKRSKNMLVSETQAYREHKSAMLDFSISLEIDMYELSILDSLVRESN